MNVCCNIKSLLLLSVLSFSASKALGQTAVSPEQAAIDQFKACVENALSNGTTAAQVLAVCKNEKAALDELEPKLSKEILLFLIDSK